MNSENRPIIITMVIVVVSIVVIFGILIFAVDSNQLTEEEKAERIFDDNAYIKGNENAEITITTFEDFECPACATVQPVFDQILDEFEGQVNFVYRHLPLVNIHPNAYPAAEASEAAGAQGKFYEYHDILFQNQNEWNILSGDDLTEKFLDYAEQAEVEDLDRFQEEYNDNFYTNKVSEDADDAEALGVSGTPTVFINTTQVSSTYEAMKQIIEEEINSNE